MWIRGQHMNHCRNIVYNYLNVVPTSTSKWIGHLGTVAGRISKPGWKWHRAWSRNGRVKQSRETDAEYESHGLISVLSVEPTYYCVVLPDMSLYSIYPDIKINYIFECACTVIVIPDKRWNKFPSSLRHFRRANKIGWLSHDLIGTAKVTDRRRKLVKL